VAEELYDVRADPGEQRNLAENEWERLLSMRSKMADWLAEYADTPEHPRYRYLLRFAESRARNLAAPRSYLVARDGELHTSPAHTTITGARVDIADGAVPLGVIDLSEPEGSTPVVVRCAASGLPLATILGPVARLNLAVMRTNCVGDGDPSRAPRPGEALFSATREASDAPDSRTPRREALPELRNALRRWGYVRDK
jgi:hypothetical protein